MKTPDLSVAAASTVRELAEGHEAVILAQALVVRLRADGRDDLAASVAEAVGILNPNPPDPHR